MSVGLALTSAASYELPRIELARIAQAAERLAVGVPVGLMDPASSLLGRKGHALLLDCGTEEHRLVPLPPGIALVVFDSGVRHALEDSGYGDRRFELERALSAIGTDRPSSLTAAEADAEADAAGVDEVARRRLRHVVTENERVRRGRRRARGSGRRRTSPRSARSSARVTRASGTTSRSRSRSSTCSSSSPTTHGAVAARMIGGGFGGLGRRAGSC